MRKIVISVIGLLIIGAGFFGMKKMAATEKAARPQEKKAIPSVYTEIVKNSDSPITVTASGNLAARDRIEIYSEVQGIFEHSDMSFKPGVRYSEGAVLLRLNSDEHRANLRSQKSSLYNQIVAILPDLRFDYPQAYESWKNYVTEFDINGNVQAFPQAQSEQEKLFIAGKNLTTAWHNLKNLEERLRKYTIHAPYNGVLTLANVTEGALVRSGQKLGEFINPRIYELEVAVNSGYVDLLREGSKVSVHNLERTKSWNGTIKRLNSLIDPNTQTIQAFIQVSGSGLREGMYLEADIRAKNESNSYTISRKLLLDNNQVYVLNGDQLELQTVEPVFFNEKTAIVRGLVDGAEILSKMLPGAYEGMQVQRAEN